MATPGDIRAGAAYVEVSADKGRLKADLAGIRQDLAQFSAQGGGGLFGDVDVKGWLRTGGAMYAVRGGADMLRGVMAAVRGDAEGVAVAIEGLPLGIGGTVSALAGLYADVAGITDEIRQWSQYAARAAREGAVFGGVLRNLRDIRRGAEERAGLAGLEGDALEIARERLRVDKEREKVRAQAKAGGLSMEDRRIREALAALDADLAASLDKIARRGAAAAVKVERDLKEALGAKALADSGRAIDDHIASWARYSATVEGLADELALLKGTMDDLSLAEKKALRGVAEDAVAGLLTTEELTRRLGEIKGLYAELRSVRAGVESEEALRKATLAALEAAGDLPVFRAFTSGAGGTMSSVEAMTTGGAQSSMDKIAEATARSADELRRIRIVEERLGVHAFS